jgi:hypothetical protein
MKKIFKYLSVTAFSGVLVLSLAATANAQHHPGGGGGGGGGGSAPAPRSSPAPSVQSSRPAPSQSFSRPSSTAPRPSGTAVRSFNNNGGQRYIQRNGVTQRVYSSGHNGVGLRGTTGVTARPYRSYQGSVYGHNHPGYSGGGVRAGYLPGHAYYHYNHGYYGSYYGPRLGFSVGFLPYGYYPFYFDDYQYFYSGGLFYQYQNDQYTVVEPPVGAEIKTLPSNAQSIVINGQQYYEVNGVYYEPITKDDGTLSYQVAGKDGELNTDGGDQNGDNGPPPPQIGDVVTQLPPNCRKININGDKLYLSEDGVYYKAQLDQDNNKVYKIVGLPADDGQDQGQPDQGN